MASLALRKTVLLSGALLSFLSLPLAAQAFEGVLTMREVRLNATTVLAPDTDPVAVLRSAADNLEALLASDSNAAPARVSYYLKGGKLRSTPPDAPGAGPEYLILDLTSGVYRIVQPTQGIVLEWTRRAPEVNDGLDRGEAVAGELEPFAEGREINGFSCIGFMLDDGEGFIEVSWLTNDVPELTIAFAELAALSASLGADETASRPFDRLLEHGFPVLTMTYDRNTGGLTIAEVERVNRQSLEDAMFEPPAGFATVSITP